MSEMLSVSNGLVHLEVDHELGQEAREANSDADSSPEHQPATGRKRRPPASRTAFPRKRAVKACHHCRTRRTKCDNARPSCGSCLKIGARCSYDGVDHSSFDPASLAIIEKLHELDESMKQGFQQLQGGSALSHLATVAAIESPNHALLQHEGLFDMKNEPSSRMSVEGILGWTPFDDLRPQLNLTHLLSPQEEVDATPPPTASFDVGDEHELLQRFVDHVLTFNPIIDEEVVRQYFRDVQYTGMRWDAQSCVLLLIYAHGALTYADDLPNQVESVSFRRTREFMRAQSYFYAAQARMSSMLFKSGIIEAQCFFLSGVYLMTTMRPLAAWRMFVQALTCCQVLLSGVDKAGGADQRQIGLQQSLYWTCFKSELELRLELNITKNPVFDLSYPDFYPSPPRAIHSDKEVVWYYYLAEIALRRLGNRVLNTFHKNKPIITSSVASSMVQNFENQAANWLSSLPTALKPEISSELERDERLETVLRYILNGHLIDCYEMMYWHFLGHFFEEDTPSTSQAIETYASKALQICVQRIQSDSFGFRRRHHGTWLMLRSCTRSALILLAASRNPHLHALLPQGWQGAVEQVKGLLRFWRQESQDAANRLEVIDHMT